MNAIQKLSEQLRTVELKRAMGLDPELQLEPRTVRALWQQKKMTGLSAKLSPQFSPAQLEREASALLLHGGA